MLYVNPELGVGFNGASLLPGASGRETKALKEFEQLFLFQMLKEMRRTVPEGGLFETSGVRKAYFDEMLDDYLAGQMAESGQLGIAREMQEQIDARNAPAPSANPGISKDGATPGISLNHAGPSGIPYRRTDAGIAIPAKDSLPLPIPVHRAGIPISPSGSIGVPLSRAQDGYRENQ